jgi:hypothetical protein
VAAGWAEAAAALAAARVAGARERGRIGLAVVGEEIKSTTLFVAQIKIVILPLYIYSLCSTCTPRNYKKSPNRSGLIYL